MAFDSARKYLARVVPWDGSAYVNLHYNLPATHHKGVAWRGSPLLGLDEAVRQLAWIMARPTTRDVYVCMASQREYDERTGASGKLFKVAKRSRENAVKLKSLFIDIDVKAGAYASQKAATTALSHFIAATKLPKPTVVVSSGSGGLHIYWALSEALTVQEWQPLANALAEATREQGLLCDTQCTVDAARILRVPDTFNWKKAQKKPVTLIMCRDVDCQLEVVHAALAPWVGKNPITPKLPSQVIGGDELSAGIATGARPRELNAVAEICPFVNNAFSTGGAALSNPLWNLTTLIATFCQEGEDAAHWMADQHPGYTEESTADLYARKLRERESGRIGYVKCATIHRTGAEECATCPHLAAQSSPLTMATPITTPNLPAVISIGDNLGIVDPYKRKADGTVETKVFNKDTETEETVVLFPYPINNAWSQKDPWLLHFETTYKGDERLDVCISFDDLADCNAASKALSRSGLPMVVQPITRDFLMSWMKTLRDARDGVIETVPFGWVTSKTDTDDILGFAYAGKVFTPNGDKPAGQPDPELQRQYSPTGSIAYWSAAAELINSQGRPDLDCILASAFAAPLIKFTGESGAVIGAYSLESGIGKTTALKVAQAVWGDSQRGLQGLDDTENALFAKIGQLRSLPVYYDEIKTTKQSEKLVSILFNMSRGKEKSRQRANTSLRETQTWETILTYASNESMMDPVVQGTRTTPAGILRLFEFKVAPAADGPSDRPTVSRLVSRLTNHFGNAGLAYAEYLGKNFRAVDAIIGKTQQKFDREWGAANEERFWIATITSLYIGAKIANTLALTKFDTQALIEFLHRELIRMRAEKAGAQNNMEKQINVITLLGSFLAEKRHQRTLITNRTWISRGKPPKNTITIKSDVTRLQVLDAQISVEDQILRFTSTSLGEWLAHKNIPRYSFVEMLKARLGAKALVGRMGSGTPVASPTEHLFEIQFGGTELEQHIELDTYR